MTGSPSALTRNRDVRGVLTGSAIQVGNTEDVGGTALRAGEGVGAGVELTLAFLKSHILGWDGSGD